MTQISAVKPSVKPSYNELKQKVAELEREIEGYKEEIIAIKELEYHKNILENKVEERTKKLAGKNKKLLEEIEFHQEVEKRLTKTEQRYRILFEKANDGIALVEPKTGDIMDCNQAFIRLVGWEKTDLFRISLSSQESSCQGQKSLVKAIQESIGNPPGFTFETQLLTKTAEIKDIEIKSTRIELHNRTYLLNTFRDITNQRRSEQQKLTHEIIKAQEKDRARISREIHDDIGQSLFTIKLLNGMLFSQIKNSIRKSTFQELYNKIMHQYAEISAKIKNISRNLSPIGLKDLGLSQAILELVDHFEMLYPIKIEAQLTQIDGFLPENWCINLYRIIQESLSNIVKHSKADNVKIISKIINDCLFLYIIDDGKGFDLDRLNNQNGSYRGTGLRIMKERVNLFSGTFEVRTKKNKGTEIQIGIPKRKI